MHKRYVNHCTISYSLIPDGPILIKASEEGADPTKPNMEFVETYHREGKTIYLPGSSLKGALRAHAERIVRTVGSETRVEEKIWANDPLNDDYKYLEGKVPAEIYQLSSFTDQMFGNTAIASRVRCEDAYPQDPKQLKLEERNGVAIDRVYGSVAVGPFNYQVCTAGKFQGKIHLKNFTLPQLGLIALVLRDLHQGWFGIGFAKSRGMGTVKVELNQAVVEYPGCIISGDKISLLGSDKTWKTNQLLGAGEFLTEEEKNKYGFPTNDLQDTPVAGSLMDLNLGVQLVFEEEIGVKKLFTPSVIAWRRLLEGVTA